MKSIKIAVFSIAYLSCSFVLADHHAFWDTDDLLARKVRTENVRIMAAAAQAMAEKVAHQKTNGDLDRYKDERGTYSKALEHQSNGMVKDSSFKSMIKALKSGKPKDFDAIVLGGARHLTNPHAAYAYSLEGADVAAYAMSPAPKLTSDQAAAEMVELYWGALLRDVPFNEYSSNPIAVAAIADLNTMSHFKGPKIDGLVTPQTLWRGVAPGGLVGPYISQFLYQPIPDHGRLVEQLYYSYAPGIDFLTDVADFLLVEDGGSTGKKTVFQKTSRYIFTGRDLATYVHKDYVPEAWVNAARILSSYGVAALDKNNPYKNNPTQDGFVTYGDAKVLELVAVAAAAALKAAWYQKWMVHLRLRPEQFGFLVQDQKVNGADFGLHDQLINSPVLAQVFGLYGTYLLPQAYPEGSPTHPSYPAGHAVISGACATILKAFFDEDFVFSNTVKQNLKNKRIKS